MIAAICRMTNKHFSPLMIVLVLMGVIANFVLYRQKESLKAELQARNTEIELITADNHNLANQIEQSHIQLEAYQKQVENLNNQVLAKMKQAEQRSYEILNELENHKAWSDTHVPNSVGRLFNQRKNTLPNRQTESADLPEKN